MSGLDLIFRTGGTPTRRPCGLLRSPDHTDYAWHAHNHPIHGGPTTPPHRVGLDAMANTLTKEIRSQNLEICMSCVPVSPISPFLVYTPTFVAAVYTFLHARCHLGYLVTSSTQRSADAV